MAEQQTPTAERTDAAETAADTAPGTTTRPAPPAAADLVEQDLLVEDVSIDGMCGVY